MIQATLAICVILASVTAELSGRVVDEQNQPVEGAIVAISTAKPRVGKAMTCPSCYRDCTKRTRTDSAGRFKFEGLSVELWFSLSAGASGHQGVVTKYYDPAQQPKIELMLESLRPTTSNTLIRGTVVSQAGVPIANAEIRCGEICGKDRIYRNTDSSVTPLTLTDAGGKFQISVGDSIRSLDVRVFATGYAPQEFHWQPAASSSLSFVLDRSASIRGQLLLDGVPLAAVEVGMMLKPDRTATVFTAAEMTTDKQGYFQFDQLTPDVEYHLYTHTGQHADGVLPISAIQAPAPGLLADLGSIPAQRPQRLTISVCSEDGVPLPMDGYVAIDRNGAWRGTQLDLSRRPRAEVSLDDVPNETFQISVRVPGYVVVKTNPQLVVDLNQHYSVQVNGQTDVEFVVRKVGINQPQAKSLQSDEI